MSNNKMLIDATHPEETRVVVLRGGRVEEFDFESAARKLLRGNIYLAKVTRVEPSLQAAFIEYGGNRHGFLAFNEIHPDYYQIPVADRQALIEEEAAAEAAEEAAVDARAEALARRRQRAQDRDEEEPAGAQESEFVEVIDGEGSESDRQPPRTLAEDTLPEDERIAEPAGEDEEEFADNENTFQTAAEAVAAPEEASDEAGPAPQAAGTEAVQEVESNGASVEVERVEQVGSGEDALEELPSRPRRRPRSYKIQEVIKRRQVILVQVVKEERGNKGAALTTYLSLAGRYTVLMPNTARGGGISRKITNPQDRKRLKAIAAELEVPEGMGLIIRTAGAARTKQEIKRDFEYLLRLWESVRELTLQSQAPNLVYEEGNLIKRSIRDLYNKDVEEIIVAGGEAHKEAKEFMRMLMPSHAKNVIAYEEPEPLFTRFQIERQLNAMFSPYVTLRSGGYLVINQTEALVAIDVNSGKATREFSIEETALHTNLEAADEIARQLKLRDLAGLIVIDFIDMEEKRNNRAVERRLKEALRFDRARIQVGRISHFGLLEMSRQRLRTGVLEGSTSQCPHCQGTGIIRSTESVALAVLRGLEDAITGGARTPLVATTTPSVALYILNNKRAFINDMEARHGLPITVTGSDKLAGANFTIERGTAPSVPQRRVERGAVNMDWGFEGEEDADLDAKEPAGGREAPVAQRSGEDEGAHRKRRRRRRGGRRGERHEAGGEHMHADDDHPHAHALPEAGDADDGTEQESFAEPRGGRGEGDDRGGRGEGDDRRGRNRRRGRRGGRRGRERQARTDGAPSPDSGGDADGEAGARAPSDQPAYAAAAPQSGGRWEGKDAARESVDAYAGASRESSESSQVEAKADREAHAETPKRAHHRAGSSEPRLERIVVGEKRPADADSAPEEGASPSRKGWWQRRLSGE